MNKILTALALLLLASCSGFNQDPLKDYPDNIRNGVPPSDLQGKPDRSALCEDCFRVDVDDVVEFSEGQQVTVDVGVRIFVPVSSFNLTVDNMDTFAGATFDEDTTQATPTSKRYKFTWTPPDGYTGSNPILTAPINFKVIADTGKITEITRVVKALVYKSFKVPTIISADFDKYEVLEGETAKLTVLIEDSDSTDVDPPRVQFTSQGGSGDGSVFLTFSSVTRDTSGPNRWEVVYGFNTRDNDITANQQDEEITLSALTRYGVKSQSSFISIEVNNALKEALSSLPANASYTFVKGIKNAVSFTIFDPTFDGTVSALLKTDTSTLPGTVALNCAFPDATKKYNLNCEFSWDIPATATAPTTPTSFEVDFKNSGVSGFTNMTKTSKTTFTVNVGG